jgi:toxin ParE1/3/4
MPAIVWRSGASADLMAIISYIAERNPQAAAKLKAAIEDAVVPLAEHPYLYRPGRVSGTREIVVHPNYIVVYRVGLEQVEVVAVLHARQQYP